MAKIKRRPSRGLLKKHKKIGRSQQKKKNFQGIAELKSSWDPELPARVNYENLGIRLDIDKPTETPFKKEVFSELSTASEFAVTKEKLADWEIKILQNLIKKHGEDYKAMAKNIKINTWQWTANKIKKMIELYNNESS